MDKRMTEFQNKKKSICSDRFLGNYMSIDKNRTNQPFLLTYFNTFHVGWMVSYFSPTFFWLLVSSFPQETRPMYHSLFYLILLCMFLITLLFKNGIRQIVISGYLDKKTLGDKQKNKTWWNWYGD